MVLRVCRQCARRSERCRGRLSGHVPHPGQKGPITMGSRLAGPVAPSGRIPAGHPSPVVRGPAAQARAPRSRGEISSVCERGDRDELFVLASRGNRPAAGAVSRAGGALRLAGPHSREGGPAPWAGRSERSRAAREGASNCCGAGYAGAAWEARRALDREKSPGGHSELSRSCCQVI